MNINQIQIIIIDIEMMSFNNLIFKSEQLDKNRKECFSDSISTFLSGYYQRPGPIRNRFSIPLTVNAITTRYLLNY